MATSNTVTSTDEVHASQYNDLRDDILNSTTGHPHDGTPDGGKKLLVSSIYPQGTTSGLNADMLDGLHASDYCIYASGTHAALPTAGARGRIYLPSDLKVLLVDDGAKWHYLGGDPLFTGVCSEPMLRDVDIVMPKDVSSGSYVFSPAATYRGYWQLECTTTSGITYARSKFTASNTGTFVSVPSRAPIVIRGRVRLVLQTGFGPFEEPGPRALRFGFVDAPEAVDSTRQNGPDNGIYFELPYFASGGDDNWRAVTRKEGTSTSTDTGIAGLRAEMEHPVLMSIMEILIDSTSQVRFKINNTLVATSTTNIPTSRLMFQCALYSWAEGAHHAWYSGLFYADKRS